MRRFLRSLLAPSRHDAQAIQQIQAQRQEYARLTDAELRAAGGRAKSLAQVIALTAVAASRVLGQDMYEVQLRGALALARGSIAEMQTGEGKTLAAVPAIVWYALQGHAVHVMTANDYLARRDAAWMGEIYRFLNLSAGCVQQGMEAEERRAAYARNITYATPNEIGFDFLRDRLALRLDQQVHRPFGAAVIDEADSILIDEARIPLVIAGGATTLPRPAHAAEWLVRHFQADLHFTVDAGRYNAALTDAGIRAVEDSFRCGNLFEDRNLPLHTAVQDALHAHALLQRDVDYVVRNGGVEMVDECKGRIAVDRRWPAGLHAALEAKEGLAPKQQGMVLGSITLQHLIALYPKVCGMTGTAATQALELERVYGLRVETIPTNRPVIRVDHPDVVFAARQERDEAVASEVRRIHDTGQPVLVGTASVADSEQLSRALSGIPHRVLNARNDEQEAAVIAGAGQRGAVTISTNMAGRGVDIQLGEGVVELGGLYVIGTNKHESRRIDNQLRGRAGRQGDPGCSRFFLSLEDDLIRKYGDLDAEGDKDPGTIQRLVEGHHLDCRQFLYSYDVPLEGQRRQLHEYRQQVLEGQIECGSERERLMTLRTIDDLWAEHLFRVADFRSGLQWLSWGGRDPHYAYLKNIHAWFKELQEALPGEIARRVEEADAGGVPDTGERGAVWTYLTKDEPFGSLTQRILQGLRRKLKTRELLG